MAAKVIKEFHGHSGSTVHLMEDEHGPYVFKKGNVHRNVERIKALSGFVKVPVIFKVDEENDELYMEYVHGLDMRNYLKSSGTSGLISFISDAIDTFRFAKTVDKDYTDVYLDNLAWMDQFIQSPFVFTKDELIAALPKVLPQSMYHGDMTLENIIYSLDGEFFFIDPVTTPYDSWVFDLAKLRQDLDCKWFLRKDNIMLDVKLNHIHEELFNDFPMAQDDNLLILMLLRVFKHCKPNTLEYDFIVREANKLWK